MRTVSDGRIDLTKPTTEKSPQLQTQDENTAELIRAATVAAATIGAIYEWLERVEKAGGATSISGVASANAMFQSLRKNADRTEKLVMEPLRRAIAKSTEPEVERDTDGGVAKAAAALQNRMED